MFNIFEDDPIRRIYLGLLWGDEGKGKLVDEAVQEAKVRGNGRRTVVTRFQGGSNAGHTVYIRKENGLEKFVTHASPSGLAHNVDIAMGPHFAFDPKQFASEVEEAVERFGYDGRVLISERAGVLLDYHRLIDSWREDEGNSDIGTTKSGIGPFYEDNASRLRRIRFTDYVSDEFPDILREVLENETSLSRIDGVDTDKLLEKIVEEHEAVRKQLAPFAENLPYRMREYLENGDNVIVEGAQGAMLDVDWGDGRYVTSSHLLSGDAFSRLGLPMNFDIHGVEKIYPTRVGGGQLPTMTNPEFSKKVQELAGEKGATTGRPRRVGYPDLALVKFTANLLNNCDGIYLTRADCVQDMDLKVGRGYRVNGEETSEVPSDFDSIDDVVYADRSFNWHLWDGPSDLSDPEDVHEALELSRAEYVAGGFESLPSELREYIDFHDEYVGVPTVGVSIGPARGETVLRD